MSADARTPVAELHNATAASLRGTLLRSTKQWIQETYGYDVYRRALESLAPDDRAVIEPQTLASSLYPVDAWDRFLRRVRHEVKASHGETEQVFDRRNVRESGSRALRAAYSFLLGLFHPTLVVPRIGLLFQRLISEGSVEVLENVSGSCRLRLTAPLAFRENVQHHFPFTIELLLELAKGRNVNVTVLRDEPRGSHFVMELAARYER